MKIVVTGAGGQLGQALQARIEAGGQTSIAWSRPDHDVSNPEISDAVANASPDVVINAAAWTDVDGAESAPDAAYATNALGPHYLADGCARCGAALVQVSTNEVFGGEVGRTYREYDGMSPGTIYARSKAAGESAALQRTAQVYIVRVAWLYGQGAGNFPAKILSAADKHGALRVVADEYGNPTYAVDAADAILRLIHTGRYGIYHLINEGVASRYDWAATALALTGRTHVPVSPIGLHEWPRPATPPRHAVLVNQAAAALGIQLRPWQEALADFLQGKSK